MGAAEKIALGVVGVAFVTTLVLPDRKTAQVLTSLFSGFTASLKQAMGR